MKDHMLSHSGQLPTCQIGTHKDMNKGKGRSFKFGKNLEANNKTKHERAYHYKCDQCDYSTDSKGYWSSQNRNTFVMTVGKPLMANLL